MRTSVNKIKYIEHINNRKKTPIFFQKWWLDAVCGEENWNAIIALNGEEIAGVLPFSIKRKFGFKCIEPFLLTPFSGHLINYPPGIKESNKLNHTHKTIQALYNGLPSFHYLKQFLLPGYKNWLPLYWENFKQTTRFTYQLDLSNSLENLYLNLDATAKQYIKKAEELFRVAKSDDSKLVFELIKESFKKKNIPLLYDYHKLNNLYRACKKQAACTYLLALSSQDQPKAALLLASDQNTVFNLLRATHPDCQKSGVSSLLVWNAIKIAKQENAVTFDFAGSMIKSIESFIRTFGAHQVPYYQITKSNSGLYDIIAKSKRELLIFK